MRINCWLLTLFLAFTSADAISYDKKYFDCGRYGQDCLSGGTCDNGTCVCPNSTGGFDCLLNTDLRWKGDCPNDKNFCGTEGICFDNNNQKACYCPPYLYGNNCQNRRFRVHCSKDSMTMLLEPAGHFQGVVYLKEAEKVAGCMYDLKQMNYQIFIDDSNVSCAHIIKNSSAKHRTMIVQFNKKFRTSLDLSVTFVCGEGTNEIQIDKVISVESMSGKIAEETVDNEPTIDHTKVFFHVKLSNGTEPQGPISLQNNLHFEFRVPTLAENGYEGLRVESCIADNELTGDKRETMTIIENSCPSKQVQKLMSEKPQKESAIYEHFWLFPFHFNNNDVISFTCTVKVCPENTGDYCKLPSCDELGKRRKRRSGGAQEMTVRKVLFINS